MESSFTLFHPRKPFCWSLAPPPLPGQSKHANRTGNLIAAKRDQGSVTWEEYQGCQDCCLSMSEGFWRERNLFVCLFVCFFQRSFRKAEVETMNEQTEVSSTESVRTMASRSIEGYAAGRDSWVVSRNSSNFCCFCRKERILLWCSNYLFIFPLSDYAQIFFSLSWKLEPVQVSLYGPQLSIKVVIRMHTIFNFISVFFL